MIALLQINRWQYYLLCIIRQRWWLWKPISTPVKKKKVNCNLKCHYHNFDSHNCDFTSHNFDYISQSHNCNYLSQYCDCISRNFKFFSLNRNFITHNVTLCLKMWLHISHCDFISRNSEYVSANCDFILFLTVWLYIRQL